jgi:hypothetical protein
MPEFEISQSERHFLSHWTYETSIPFWGPATIWCWNQRVIPAYGPDPLAELLWKQEREACRETWFSDRPQVSFQIPWMSVDGFWRRAMAAVAMIPRLQDDYRFKASSHLIIVKCALTQNEKDYLRAYNHEMVQTGAGYQITLAHQHGVLQHHRIPFFSVLEDLYRKPVMPVTYPWTNFPARYEQLSGRRYDPDFVLIPR